ncbi:PDR/VanB family oxidoreductase [Acuticoccus kandeliae]|uniref:PDR/VanB family oxidoreductase n=1 Tax=Acuticoccus kandeliae TaxID=2073160 RepID=UPI000D3E9F01|nr:PDR/VanB family oxidoreductase [Acuticoccus kandeliae]
MARHVTTVVRRIESLTPEIRLLELMDPDGWPLPPFTAGAHIDLHLPNGLTRSYSLCGDPAVKDRWVLAVLREAAGRGGSAAVHDLALGDEVACSLPRNHFPVAREARRHVLLAAGIGVTPFLAMAASLDRAGADHHLHFWAREPAAAPFLAEIEARAEAGRATLHFTRTGDGSAARLAEIVAAEAGEGVHVYACGPTRFLDAYEAATAGLDPETVHQEYFVPPPVPERAGAGPFEVEFAKSGRVVIVEPGDTILAAARREGIAVEASCEGGICGACKVAVLAGTPDHADRVLKASERAEAMMICVGGAKSPRLVLDL